MARLLACLILLCALPARADRFSSALAFEGWGDENIPGHGVALLAWDTKELWRGMRLGVVYNTDTVRFSMYGLRTGKVELAAQLTNQFGLTGLLTDYYQNGNSVEGRGFVAHQVAFDLAAKAEIAERTYFELVMGVQRFIADESERDGIATAESFELPDNPMLVRPRLRYTWWNLAHDRAWSDRHRFFPRLRGLAVGGELGIDLRSNNTPWGARDPQTLERLDTRNRPDKAAFATKLWLKGGWQFSGWGRVQTDGVASLGVGQDDLNRDRLGGSNPYVVPLPGAPWASWISSRYASDLVSLHFKASDGLEIGPMAGLLLVTDPDRVDALDEVALLWGAGLLVDWRIDPSWQVDLRGGYSPSVSDRADRAAWNVWISTGWAYEG